MLADDFFLVAHHDVTGRGRLSHHAVSLGLAAGLLGELLSADVIRLTGDDLVVLGGGRPENLLGAAVFSEVAAERVVQPVPVWLAFLAQSSYARVGDRLARAGRLEVRRRLGRVSYVPVSMNDAALPAALLSQKLRRNQFLDFADVCLAGLVLATGLDRFLLDGAGPEASARLEWYVSHSWPPMRSLVDHTQAAVGKAVLAHRS